MSAVVVKKIRGWQTGMNIEEKLLFEVGVFEKRKNDSSRADMDDKVVESSLDVIPDDDVFARRRVPVTYKV
jgi:hypothetical protein